MSNYSRCRRIRSKVEALQEQRIDYIPADQIPAWLKELDDILLQPAESGTFTPRQSKRLVDRLARRGIRLSLLLLESERVRRGMRTPS
jgi:hypothetical protein